MSIESVAIALHHSRSKGTTKLVLIGIANHDGDGGAWPSVRTLAKYAACSESQVQRATAKLAELGEIRIHRQGGGNRDMQDWRRPNRYDVLLSCPSDCDRTKNHRTIRTSATPLPTFTDEPVDNPVDSYPQRVAPMRPGRTHATGGGRTHATRTVHITHRSPSIDQPQTARARDLGACGHKLIEPELRHCVVGCPPQNVREQ